MDHIAFCYRSGEIDIASANSPLPEGVLSFAIGPRDRLEEIISTRARHSYDAETYLVPGLPEATDDVDVVVVVLDWLAFALGECPMDATHPHLRRVS